MTEPREIAPHAAEVVPGLWTWSISNSHIGGHTSTSHALLTREGCVLIEPVRRDEAAMAALNEEHMGHEGPTDVLSFPIDGPGAGPDGLLGDVVVLSLIHISEPTRPY